MYAHPLQLVYDNKTLLWFICIIVIHHNVLFIIKFLYIFLIRNRTFTYVVLYFDPPLKKFCELLRDKRYLKINPC